MIRDAISLVVDGNDLETSSAREVMKEIMGGAATQAQIGSFITAMRIKGETVNELIGFATAMREGCSKINSPPNAVDLCGTGGDNLNTFNISTVASFVVSAAGVPVAKHGNRSVSSKSGSADMLAALGIPIDLDPKSVEQVLNSVGIGFMFAPLFHISMKNVANPRREIGIRTFFNILGPLTNPAGVKNQLIGVYDPELARKMAMVLKELGSNHAFIVNSKGMDEVSNIDETHVVELRSGEISSFTIKPGMFGFEYGKLENLKGGGPEENARIALSILNGEQTPRRDVVAMNAGLAIRASGKVNSIIEGVRLASDLIDEGPALKKMKEFSDFVTKIDIARQKSMDVGLLVQRKIQIDVIQERSTEIVGELLKCCQEKESCNAMIKMLDERIIANPNVLSVLVLNRINRIAHYGHQNIERHDQSKKTLYESISSCEGIGLIGEYKPNSPSTSPLMVAPAPEAVIEAYGSGGLAGVSVLTEPTYFDGSLSTFSRFRSQLDIPLLFKDFVISKEQIEIARASGADAILLMAKVLNRDSLALLIEECNRLKIEPLVELHDEDDVEKLNSIGSAESVKLLGVNSRNFSTMKTDLSSVDAVRRLLPKDKLVILESGISSAKDIQRLRGFDAVLMGSLFMQASNLKRQVKEIVAACRSVSP